MWLTNMCPVGTLVWLANICQAVTLRLTNICPTVTSVWPSHCSPNGLLQSSMVQFSYSRTNCGKEISAIFWLNIREIKALEKTGGQFNHQRLYFKPKFVIGLDNTMHSTKGLMAIFHIFEKIKIRLQKLNLLVMFTQSCNFWRFFLIFSETVNCKEMRMFALH